MADTTLVIAILNHHRIAVKIPTRPFLVDFGLVGASVFVLACLAQPQTESWVATIQRDDGSVQSIRVDYQGDDAEGARQMILGGLMPPESPKRGLARWQSETSRYYALADSQRMDSSVADRSQEETPIFQTASFQASNEPGSKTAASAGGWIEFWNRRGDQSASWLDKYSDFQQQRVSRISDSLVVARFAPFFPARTGVLLAITMSVCVLSIGLLWCAWIPRRTLPGPAGFTGITSSQGDVDPSTEPAVMSFRSSWVRLKQPFAVHARRTLGWMIVLSAIVTIVGRLL